MREKIVHILYVPCVGQKPTHSVWSPHWWGVISNRLLGSSGCWGPHLWVSLAARWPWGPVFFSAGRPLRSRFVTKYKRYAKFGKRTGIVNIPFVMGIHGTISPDTLEQIEPLLTHAINPMQLRKDIIANTQMELLRSLYNSTLIISASFSSTTALRQQSFQSPAADPAAVIVPVPRAPANQAPANRASLTPGRPNRNSDLTDLTDDELTIDELLRQHNTRHSASNLSHGPPDQPQQVNNSDNSRQEHVNN